MVNVISCSNLHVCYEIPQDVKLDNACNRVRQNSASKQYTFICTMHVHVDVYTLYVNYITILYHINYCTCTCVFP